MKRKREEEGKRVRIKPKNMSSFTDGITYTRTKF